MAVTFVQKGTFKSGTLTYTASLATTTSGNLALLFCHSANQTIPTPSGWTEVGTQSGTGTAAAAGGVRIAVFKQVCAGTELKAICNDLGAIQCAIMMEFAGSTGTPAVNTWATTLDTVATLSISCASVSPTHPALVINAIALDRDANESDFIAAISNTALTSLTEQHDQTVSTDVGGGLAVITGSLAAAGSSGSTKASSGNATTHAYMTIALTEPQAVTGTAAAWSLLYGEGTAFDLAVPQVVTASAATWDIAAGSASIAQPVSIAGTAAIWTVTGGTGDAAYELGSFLLPDIGLVTPDLPLLLPGGLFDGAPTGFAVDEPIEVTGAAATITFTAGTGEVRQDQVVTGTAPALVFTAGAGSIGIGVAIPSSESERLIVLAGNSAAVVYSTILTATAPTLTFTAGAATVAQSVTVTGSAATITFTAGAATIAQPVTITGTTPTLLLDASDAAIRQDQIVSVGGGGGPPIAWAFVAGAAAVSQSNDVTGTAATWDVSGAAATLRQDQLVTGTAGAWSWARGEETPAAIRQDQLVSGAAATWSFATGTATVAQGVPITVEGTAATISFAGGSFVVEQSFPTYLIPDVGLVSTADIVLLPGGLLDPYERASNAISASAATWSFAAGTATIAQAAIVEAVAAEISFSAGSAGIAQAASISVAPATLALISGGASIGYTALSAYLLPGVGLVETSSSVLLPGALLAPEEAAAAGEAIAVTAATITFVAGAATISQSHLADISWFELYLSDVVSATTPTWAWTASTFAATQKQQVDATASAWTFEAGSAAVTQPMLLSATAATITFVAVAGDVRQAYLVEVVAPTWTFDAGAAGIGQLQNVAAAAAEWTLVAGTATVVQEQIVVTVTAGEWTITGGTADVVQAYLVEVAAPTLELVGSTFDPSQRQYLDASTAVIAFSVGQGEISEVQEFTPGELVLMWADERAEISHHSVLEAAAGTWGVTGGYAVFAQKDTITSTAAVWDFTVGTCEIISGAGAGGRLTRTRKRRLIYDEDTELGKLATLLGQHPPERDARHLLAAVKQGLAREFESGAPPAVEYDAAGAMYIMLGEQQVRLAGALQRHVEALLDDQDILDLLDMIA